jgi:pimeloyl-ACP methyl ester carboxylesterase
MDWLGRGNSGWLPEQSDYSLETAVEQLAQATEVLRLRRTVLVGSSFGGSAGLALSERDPEAFRAIILNDVGPFLPHGRRIHRAATLARHYVFRTPAELLRRVGAAHKNDGPLNPGIVLHNCYHLTRWSDSESGRVYRHDLRAMQAYRNEAHLDVEQWAAWERLRVPVLVLHGTESDALLPDTVARMRARPETTVVHIAATGHTPALAEPHQIDVISRWLDDSRSVADDSVISPAPPESYSAT